jgi:hypothetical protein
MRIHFEVDQGIRATILNPQVPEYYHPKAGMSRLYLNHEKM